MALTDQQRAEMLTLRQMPRQTLRPTVPAMEALLFEPFPVLDHGFIRVMDYMGDDSAITQAARVSYGTGTKQVSEDRGLIRYLMRHRHSSPFEMCEIKFHIKMPIFVARQWIRHRMANVNEYSARYSVLDKEFYIPATGQVSTQSKVNHQGRGAALDVEAAQEIQEILKQDALRCYDHYEAMLDHHGVARELARMNLTLNTYTQWYWKIDLHNLMHFLSLRADSHAQYEIRVYADKIFGILKSWVPHTAEAFEEYRLGSCHFSRTMLAVLRRRLAGEEVTQEESGLTKREWSEMMAVLQPSGSSVL